MNHRRGRSVLIALVAVVSAACGVGAPSASARPAPASYEEYSVAACAAWDELFRAVGNPDTASGSVLSRALDDAVAAGDAISAERLAAEIVTVLKTGREQVAIAGGWAPRTAVMVELDRLFVAYEAMIAAKLAAAKRDPNAVDPQAAFEAAGGVKAFFAMIEAMKAAGGGAATVPQCPNVPVTP